MLVLFLQFVTFNVHFFCIAMISTQDGLIILKKIANIACQH